MRFRTLALTFIVLASTAAVLRVEVMQAQTPAPAPAKPAAAARPAAAAKPPATVQQLMKGILYPASNVVFSAQSDDPATIKRAADPSTSPNPLTSSYGGWEAVANSSLALAEAMKLLEGPRTCSNGKPAPVQTATWKKGMAQVRAAALDAYKAAQAKNQDGIVDAAGAITEACATCHDPYREKTPRCVG